MVRRQSETRCRWNKHAAKGFFIAGLVSVTGYAVYLSGGTGESFTNLMYIPIILSAYCFGVKGAAGAALLGGLTVGPLMPLSVLEGIEQKPASWVFRIVMFLVIGVVTAFLFRNIRRLKAAEIEQSFRHVETGLPNANRLKADLQEIIERKTAFSLIGFRIMNIDDINRFTDYEIGVKAIVRATDELADCVGETVYSIFSNEFVAILPDGCGKDPRLIGMEFLQRLKEPFWIDRFKIELIAKGGIVHSTPDGEEPNRLLKKMGIALGQETNGTGLVVYDVSIEQKNKARYELMVALSEAVKNGEFHLVYQPQKSLGDGGMAGAEALLRWNRGPEGEVSPEVFVKIAEEMGLISDITKWVIRNAVGQIERWREEGISVSVAINVSAKDLRDRDVADYLRETLEAAGVEPAMIGIELTERSVLHNEKKAQQILSELQEYGIKVALDDFGTGYNSLVDLVRIPSDYLKVDKVFVDHITDEVNRTIIEAVIDFAHSTGKAVIAEGVEQKEQSEMLWEMGCDYIQGYYFSKPLPPEEIKNYARQMSKKDV
ncbi:MAG TPA: bifunctional diguanylate cyclase/phosphodiesterase [Oscillospiraceae bacterium]|nr:bifunctional diguanylate cyclase/phosphodiesterase [Oscillospiraceae bacterium]